MAAARVITAWRVRKLHTVRDQAAFSADGGGVADRARVRRAGCCSSAATMRARGKHWLMVPARLSGQAARTGRVVGRGPGRSSWLAR